mmetsp:Transcript_38420/g.69251  ORF Transcript_38420/g.69251 Transcript_38420/m.69251 type:complete len:407 (-) Transcript_38420:143-1363(-)
MSNNKRQARLFSTLASIEQTDQSATKRRKQSQLHSVQQSRAAADQTKLNGILLELRILTQRCLTEESNAATAAADVSENGTANGDGVGGNTLDDGTSRVKEEVDTLLENLLVARRDLMGHQLDDAGDSTEGDDASTSDEEKKEVDYARLIVQRTKEGQDETTSTDDESSTDSSSDNKNLTKQVQNEYSSLQSHWKSILNKHHSNLALHSGMSVNSSKFQSKAVDVSFWEQVQGGMEHERFKQRTSSSNNNQIEEGGSGSMEHLKFDDSKLYQQMLKDFISSSQSNGGTTTKMNKRGMMMDPAQEAAERLKRAMRKKSGGGTTGDIDLTSLLTETGDTANSGGMISQTNVMQNKTSTVDRRASKGRKIRYTVNPKLINFTFPVARVEPMIKEDVWFKSLFGGVGNSR